MGYWIVTKVYKTLRRAYLELSLHFLHLIFINFLYFSNLEKTYRWKKIKTKHLVFSKWWLSWQTSYRITVFTINMLSYSPPNASIFKTPCESHLPSKIIIGVSIYFKLIAIRMKKTPCSKLLKSQFERKWLCFSRIMFCFIDYIANNIKKNWSWLLIYSFGKRQTRKQVVGANAFEFIRCTQKHAEAESRWLQSFKRKNFPSKRIYSYTIVFINITFEM